jgi:SAM-dependent methyltransferase
MTTKTFTIGRRNGYEFLVSPDGWVRAAARPDGTVPVIGGQPDLRADLESPEDWSEVEEATGNNATISDGVELYAGAGFDATLIEGQVADVLWALGDAAGTPGRLLELGCGPGFLLEALQKALPGWSVVGVDPSPDSCRQAQGRGIDVRLGMLDTVDLEPGFDAIVVMGNFQLHREPAATLAGLARIAGPGATLFLDSKNPRSSARVLARWAVQTPGARRLGAAHAFAAHAFHGMRHGIPKGALSRLLEDAGWEARAVRTVAPRLLRFGNQHALAAGAKGVVWRALDAVDRATREQAWIQVAARRR